MYKRIYASSIDKSLDVARTFNGLICIEQRRKQNTTKSNKFHA